MATFALIHGGGGSAGDWHLVAPALREHGHGHYISLSRPRELADRPAAYAADTH